MARRRHGPLTAAELAEAAVLGDVALVLSFAGWLLPFPIVFFAAATVPFAALTVRRRLRAVVIATVASGQVAFMRSTAQPWLGASDSTSGPAQCWPYWSMPVRSWA